MTIEPYNYNDEPSGRSETLVQALEKCERLEKQLNIAIGVLSQYAEAPTRNLARCALDRIAEIGGDYSHYWEQQIKELEK
jgi:hypothetical protein